MSERAEEREWRWCVTDLCEPDPWGVLGPQFGPFRTEQEARTFAEMRPGYWAHIPVARYSSATQESPAAVSSAATGLADPREASRE